MITELILITEDLDIFMTIYNFLECICHKFSGSLWKCYRDKVNGSAKEIGDNDNIINSNIATTSKSFKYNRKVIGRKSDNNNRLNAEVVVLLKYVSNFQRSLDLFLTNFEI